MPELEEQPEPYIEPPPQFILLAPDYDPGNPDHVLRWEKAGRPNLEELDGDGNRWKPTVRAELQQDGSYSPILLKPPAPVTDVEILQQTVQSRLDGDEERRTGVRPNPTGAVSLSRSWAATAMLYGGWHYPSEEDLATGANPAILAAIYADPTTNTTAESPVDQKRRVLHFTLVMLEGQAFGLEYQSQLGAYERTASGAIREAIAADQRDWLDLPCHTWESVRAMFLDLLK